MRHDAGQIDRRFHARIAAADHRHALALGQRAIAMRAVGHALVPVLVFAGHIHLPPARAGGQDHRLALERCAIGQLDFDQAIGTGRDQLLGTLQIHDVHVVLAHVLLKRGSHLRAFSFRHRDEVFDRHGVQHLTTETLCSHAGADALACGIHRCCRAGRATANHQHVEGVLGGDLGGIALGGIGVELGDDLFQRHAALVEQFTVQVHGGHRHDLAGFHLVLEQRAIDGHVLDARVQHRGQVQRLHHVRAVLARQREIGFELIVAIQVLHLLDQLGSGLGRVAANLQQRQHQRGEFVPHRQAGKAH